MFTPSSRASPPAGGAAGMAAEAAGAGACALGLICRAESAAPAFGGPARGPVLSKNWAGRLGSRAGTGVHAVAGLHQNAEHVSAFDVLAQLGQLHFSRHNEFSRDSGLGLRDSFCHTLISNPESRIPNHDTAGFFFSGSIPRSLMAFSTSLA